MTLFEAFSVARYCEVLLLTFNKSYLSVEVALIKVKV